MNTLCLCGYKYSAHRGIDGACPHPRSYEMGQPLYIEGTYFRPAVNTCEALIVRHVEDTGYLCGKKCVPGKDYCNEHQVN